MEKVWAIWHGDREKLPKSRFFDKKFSTISTFRIVEKVF